MKLPRSIHFPWRSARLNKPPALLRLEGFDAEPNAVWWAATPVVIARSRCRLRWFRLAGVPAAERLAALRLQVEAWQPFESTTARLVLSGEDGLAVAWDGAAVQHELLARGLLPERCHCTPETLIQPMGEDGLRLLRVVEGFEAQHWKGGFLQASRWWAEPLTANDWQEFVHVSGAGREASVVPIQPKPQALDLQAAPWMRHYPLHASADGSGETERRLVWIGALSLTLAAGVLTHQLWDARRDGHLLTQHIQETKTALGPTLMARDATMEAVTDVERLAAWFALPLPVDVIGYLHDALGKSGVLVKDMELEGNKLRLGLQLGPNATRAGIVKDLQAGGWLTDVSEVRAEGGRALLTMEMRIVGLRPQAPGAIGASASPVLSQPAPMSGQPSAAKAPSPVPVAVQAPVTAPVQSAVTSTAPAPARPPQTPLKPIIAKPDADGMPPADVFNAIPNR